MSQELVDLIQARSRPLEPLDTGEAPVLPRMEGIRSVVFDIYGTLFISASGDISLAKAEDRSPALAASLRDAGWSLPGSGEEDLTHRFHATLEAHREARRGEGVQWPEVRIEEVWRDFTESLQEAGRLRGSGSIRTAVVAYECRVNPCWPMPGLGPFLSGLRDRQLPMGIVSNAQFYTPLLFPALTGLDLGDHGFLPNLCIWSFKERIGKPATQLYDILARRLSLRSIRPEEVLYIGNDIRNDIWPARETGFRTVLFAGDRRSLRWRGEDPLCLDVCPDAVVTDLCQIAGILG